VAEADWIEKLQCTWLLKLGHFPTTSTTASTKAEANSQGLIKCLKAADRAITQLFTVDEKKIERNKSLKGLRTGVYGRMKTPPSLIPPTRPEQDLDDRAYFAQRISLIMERKTLRTRKRSKPIKKRAAQLPRLP
jgi:hypothetical protein